MTYRVFRTPLGVVAKAGGETLPTRFDLWPHAESFDYGAATHGAAQLALAILAHHAGDEIAAHCHQQFKWAFLVEEWPLLPLEIQSEKIDTWLADRGVVLSKS